MSALLCVTVVVGLLATLTVKWARLAFSRGASQWPGFIERRVERVRVGEGAFRDQSAENVHERVIPPGMPKPLVGASIAALVAGSPVFVVSAIIFSTIAGRVFAASLRLGPEALLRGTAMLAGALLWLVATLASWRGGSATAQRKTDSALTSLRVASVSQLVSLLALAVVVVTKSRTGSPSIAEWLGALWPVIPLLPIVASTLVVSRYADEMRGHGKGIVTSDGGVRVEADASATSEPQASATAVDRDSEGRSEQTRSKPSE